ncbi:hypothetical protein [Photorhabdus khanii]|uniref:Uncharacterized protein n=1 Tax=Photorhabdus khanii subsp. guanajuatensis TaxID=2100166 RepID=A0A4R4JXX3_9GAMM|nr:hypothetical protein [Photorhabdus khanii]TDB59012.1 hypothetical protein C5467_09075 [Photorhabdus khanii subsp. guanajuatensis]
MSGFFKKMGCALVSPERVMTRLVGAHKETYSDVDQKDEKFIINRSGTVTLNRCNPDVQRAFASNVEWLSTKRKG